MTFGFPEIDKEIDFRTYDFLTSNDGDDEGLLRETFFEDINMLMNQTAGESAQDPLEANVDHLKRLLSTVLTIPRNDQEDKVSTEKFIGTNRKDAILSFQRLGTELKTEVGGYIFAKLGLSGFVTGVQTFRDKRDSESPLGNNVIGILPGTR